ncbi:MAG: hypothetical protein ACI4XM_03040 [Candidatus Coprovivens sp.]
MSKYTIELRKVCEIYGRNEVEKWFKDYEITEFLSPSQIETINKLNVWNKDRLAQKIVDHYFMREIGFETPYLFKHYAKVTMQELMEKMLPIIYSNSLEYDPLESVDFDITETRKIKGEGSGTSKGNSNSDSNNNSSGLTINSDTPQGQINKEEILSGKYASNTSGSESSSNIKDNTNTSSESTSKSESIEEFTHHEYGNKGVLDSYQKMILQYRDTIRAVDAEIIKELNILFMGLY